MPADDGGRMSRAARESRRGEDDRHRVQPGEVPAQHQPELRHRHDQGGHARDRLRREEQDRRDQLREVAADDLDPVERLRQAVEVPRERVRHRLRLVVVVEAGEIAPARIAAHLDQAGAELEAEEQPAEEPDERRGHRAPRRSEKGGEKAGLEQQRFPAEGIERLADVDDRQIERPEYEPDGDGQRRGPAIGQPGDDRERQDDAGDRDRSQQPVRVAEMEQAGRVEKACALQIARHRKQAALAEQSRELLERDGEGDQIDQPEAALENEPCDPVIGSVKPVRHRAGLR